MKTIFVILLALVVGVAVGAGIALVQVRMPPWHPIVESASELPETLPDQTVASPKDESLSPAVRIDETAFDFGGARVLKGSHVFTLRNGGNAPLHLLGTGSSAPGLTCEMEKTEIEPGQSAKITVNWEYDVPPGSIDATVTIATDDPKRNTVDLNITGTIIRVYATPGGVAKFDRVLASEPSTVNVPFLCYVDEPFEILSCEMTDPATAAFFTMSWEPISLSDARADYLAESGYLIKILARPGLPLGPFEQTLVVKTNLASKPTFTIPVTGRVAGDIAVVGNHWDADNNAVIIGAVRGNVGHQERLTLRARGPHRKEIAFKVGKVTPDVLKVSVGDATEVDNGAAVQTALVIEIPPGSPAVNCLPSRRGRPGEIEIETTSEQMPKLRILVPFAVEN
jgi:hypothetical protein